MNTLLTTISITLLTALTAVTAAAADGGGDGHGKRGQHRAKLLEQFDANKDGTLDDSERAAARAAFAAKLKEKHPEAFAKADSNHDGQLSAEEMKALRKARHHHNGDDKKGGHGKKGKRGSDKKSGDSTSSAE